MLQQHLRRGACSVRSVSRENGCVIKSIAAPASGGGLGRLAWGLGRGEEDGATDVRIIDIYRGVTRECANQPTDRPRRWKRTREKGRGVLLRVVAPAGI